MVKSLRPSCLLVHWARGWAGQRFNASLHLFPNGGADAVAFGIQFVGAHGALDCCVVTEAFEHQIGRLPDFTFFQSPLPCPSVRVQISRELQIFGAKIAACVIFIQSAKVSMKWLPILG